MRQRLRPSSLRVAAVALIASSLLLVGCSSDAEPVSSESSEPVVEPTPTPPEPTYWPLTGLEREGDAPKHPVIVTKVDNTSSSAPQVGLGAADMIVEELVEGGYTRLASFFYSKLPKAVGPVRSMRASDIGRLPHVESLRAVQPLRVPA